MDLPTHADDGHRWLTRLWLTPSTPLALLWLPALGVPARKYEAWAQSLAARGVTVAVHEWRGNDSSSLRPSRRDDWGYRQLLHSDIPASLAAAKLAAPERRWLVGGHSLGGQLAVLAAALQPQDFIGLLLVATGVPHARTFTGKYHIGINVFARLIPPLTRLFGYFPGDRLDWAGREAATLMRQWAGTVRRGDYHEVGLAGDIEIAMKRLRQPALGIRFSDDWLAPAASLAALFDKLGAGAHSNELFDDERLGERADHFRWMKRPDAVAQTVSNWAATQFL